MKRNSEYVAANAVLPLAGGEAGYGVGVKPVLFGSGSKEIDVRRRPALSQHKVKTGIECIIDIRDIDEQRVLERVIEHISRITRIVREENLSG